ncbi:MAG: TlpA disulfide reductase family protein [Verrucomicrobiota bacterium]|nr:TlpA disulfide reductase family protein [Verrucomicrobiota bacterium]
MSSSDFLFSFLLFFQVQIESIKESGFYKILAEKYPQVSQGLSQAPKMEPEIEELLKATGLDFDDLAQISLTIEGLDGISNASQEGRSPKIGSELDFLFTGNFKGELNAMKIFAFMLDKIDEEKGKEYRDKVEKTLSKDGKSASLIMPSDLLDQVFSDTDLLFLISQEGNYSKISVGLSGKMDSVPSSGDQNSSLACVNAMAKDRQITLGIKVDPALWERPEFNSQQQNPLLAGLANSVKGIREFGLSVSFREESLGLEICVNCKDTQSALGLWTVAQGGLGMAQLAMAQEGGQAPAILSRVKTQAEEKNVFVRVDILEEDFDEFEGMGLLSQSGESQEPDSKKDFNSLIGSKVPDFKAKLLDGSPFDPAEHKGKVLILDFWATWCGPCVKALPELIDATSGFGDDRVQLVAVNQGEGKKAISQFLKKEKLNGLKVALDRDRQVGGAFKVKGIPHTVIIDRKGVIRHVHVGFSSGMGDRLRTEVMKLLTE